jgi:hypothetical protein
MILRLDGSLVEFDVARAAQGSGVWLVRQDREGFMAVYEDDEREEVLGRYPTFEEAHHAASEAADEAFLAFVQAWEEEQVFRAFDELLRG